MPRSAVSLLLIVCLLAPFVASGCGLNVTSPDLFLLRRTGQGKPLTLLVSDDGTIRCNNGNARPLSDQLLLRARDLSSDLDKDAKASLRLPSGPAAVFTYQIRLQNGTISFPDTAAAAHHELAQAELFAVQAAQSACGLS